MVSVRAQMGRFSRLWVSCASGDRSQLQMVFIRRRLSIHRMSCNSGVRSVGGIGLRSLRWCWSTYHLRRGNPIRIPSLFLSVYLSWAFAFTFSLGTPFACNLKTTIERLAKWINEGKRAVLAGALNHWITKWIAWLTYRVIRISTYWLAA